MALRNILSNNSKLSFENIDVKTALTLKEDNYEIKHLLNHVNGNYTVTNKLGNKVMEFDSNLNLKPSALHQHIQSKNQEVKDVTDSHNTRISRVQNQVNTLSLATTNNVSRLTALEGVISGGAGLEIDNILAVGNDANGLEIINLSNVSSEKITVGGIELSSNAGVLTCGNNSVNVLSLYAGSINCITGGDTLLGKSIVDNSTMFAVRCSSNQIISYSDAELVGFKTINDMSYQITNLTNRIVKLEQYNTKLMELVLSISQSLVLQNARTEIDFDYTGLIPE